MVRLAVKNWTTFQHYKDRDPPWVKLHRSLLNNMDYYLLSAPAAKALPLIWLISAEQDGLLPESGELGFRLRLAVEIVEEIQNDLMLRGFLVDAATVEQAATPAQPEWGSRHISQKIRAEVWARDGGCCKWCQATENIEFDHVLPVSKGGQSTTTNLQLLCRSCNRKKRTRDATQGLDLRSLEAEREARKAEKKKKPLGQQADRFAEFWAIYPSRPGSSKPNRKGCLAKWKARGLDAQADVILADVALRLVKDKTWLDGFVCNPEVYINQDRWLDGFGALQVASAATNRQGSSPRKAETAQTHLDAVDDWARNMRALGNMDEAEIQAQVERVYAKYGPKVEK